MKKPIRKFCAATTVAALLLSASPIATPVAHAGIDWGGVIGGVLGGVLGGGGSSGGSSGGGNGGGAIGGLSNQQHAHPNPNDNEKLFMLAVEKNDIGTASDMLNVGVDVNGVYPDGYTGQTALILAIRNRNYDMMQLLLENGADVNGYYSYKNHFISYMERITDAHGEIELLQFFINWGADVNCASDRKDGRKRYPIDNSTERHAWDNEDSVITQFLIDHGAYTENKDSDGRTPFLRVVGGRKIKLMNVLADGGANINARDNRGQNALQIALDLQDLQFYKQVQDIMERGQQPSQYQPSKPQSQRRTSESSGNASGDDDLISFENNTDQKARIQELNNFNDVIIKAPRAERKAYEPFNQYIKEHPDTITITDRSALSKNLVDALIKIKVSLEPQALLSNLNHLSFDEKETCSDLLQVMNTRYDKMIDIYSLLALNRDLTQEEQGKIKILQEEIQTLGQSVIDISGRVDKFHR